MTCESCATWTAKQWCADCWEKANWPQFEKQLESPNPIFVKSNLKRYRINGKERARRNG